MKNLISALIQFQKSVKAIPKNKVNPFYNSKYAELSTVIDVCQPALNASGLAVVQTIKLQPETNDNVLVTMLCHESGETLESNIYLPKIADSQKLTGAITYLRRTSYLSILGLVADDDLDGNDVVQPTPQVNKPVNNQVNNQVNKPTFKLNEQEPFASDAQKGLLKRLGVEFNENITKSQASKLIEEANKRG